MKKLWQRLKSIWMLPHVFASDHMRINALEAELEKQRQEIIWLKGQMNQITLGSMTQLPEDKKNIPKVSGEPGQIDPLDITKILL